MELDGNAIMASLLMSTVGLGLIQYGRKAPRLPHLIAGILIALYPYFVGGALPILVIGAVLLFLLWLATRLGY